MNHLCKLRHERFVFPLGRHQALHRHDLERFSHAAKKKKSASVTLQKTSERFSHAANKLSPVNAKKTYTSIKIHASMKKKRALTRPCLPSPEAPHSPPHSQAPFPTPTPRPCRVYVARCVVSAYVPEGPKSRAFASGEGEVVGRALPGLGFRI
jgi:hypothetical protein